MSRSLELCSASSLALLLACGSGSTPTSEPPSSAAAVTEIDPSAPPQYKPSGKSVAPMAITDPAYGAFTGAPSAPGLGDTIPDFEVALADGGTFSLAQARGAGPVLLFFYRGFW
jgi:AhpC/TSA family